MKRIVLFTTLLLLCASCGGRQKSKASASATESTPATITYKVPEIPAVLSSPIEQAEYLAHHFWDNFNFADTTYINSADYTEQAFTNYVQVLLNIPHEIGDKSIGTMFGKASVNKDMFFHFSELSEKYLFEPNSPFRNDEYYITVLQSVLANPELDQWERIRPQEQLQMSLKNRVGASAADFRYTLASGATGTLYGIKATYTLVFINNPGCAACKDIQRGIESSPFLTRLIEQKQMVVLAIYPDEDLTEWRDFAPYMPAQWINSYDKNLKIKRDNLYDLKAIPTLYLVDKDKKVMLKDVMSVALIEETLYNDQQ